MGGCLPLPPPTCGGRRCRPEWEGGGAMERIKILQLQRMVREVGRDEVVKQTCYVITVMS